MLRRLGIFERALLVSDDYSPFNVVVVLQLENAPGPEIFRQALRLSQERHEVLRARIVKSAGHPSFEAIPDPDLPLTVRKRTDDQQWIDFAQREMSRRFEMGAGPLFRALYLQASSQSELILTFQHTIVDAASGMNLLDEIMKTCARLLAGQQSDLRALRLAPAVEKHFPAKYKGVSSIPGTVAFNFSQMWDEISYRNGARGKRVPSVRRGGTGHILMLTLPDRLLDLIARRARSEKVTLNSLLNATLLLAVNRHLYAGASVPMRTFTFADLRPYTLPPTPPENLANYISMLRFTVKLSGGEDIWVVARRLHEKIYRALKHGDKFSASRMSEQVLKMFTTLKSMRMSSTALNYSGAVPLKSEYGDIRISGLHAFVSSYDIGPEFAAQARLFNDQLWWDFVYLDADMDQAVGESIVGEIRSILEGAV
jgi:NRPS condensation-like uncharacterized protein